MTKPTQKQMELQARCRALVPFKVFHEIQSSSNPLTPEELKQLAKRYPARWGFLAERKGHKIMSSKLDLYAAFDALEAMGETTKRTEKEAAIKAEVTNGFLKRIMWLTYSSQRYNVYPDETCIPKKWEPKGTPIERWKELKSICSKLAKREVTGGKAFELIKTFLRKCTSRENMWYRAILARDLRIGVSDKTIEKFWPGLLHLKGQLMHKEHCMKPETWVSGAYEAPFKLWAERKMDGLRVITIIDSEGKVTLWTRGAKEVTHLKHIKKAVKGLKLKNRVLDGEMVVFGDDGKTDWKLTLSLAKPRIHISAEMEKDIKKRVKYFLFDTLPLKLWLEGSCPIPLIRRRRKLRKTLKNGPKCLILSTRKIVRDYEQINEFYNDCLERGYEGVILKNPDSGYLCRRDASWLRIKPTEDKSGKVVGFKIGEKKHAKVASKDTLRIKKLLSHFGKITTTKTGLRVKMPKDARQVSALQDSLGLDLRQRLTWDQQHVSFRTAPRLGALVVETEDDGELIDVGGGLSHIQREEIWDARKKYKGQRIDYKQQKDAGDVGATRFPVFIRWRAD